MNEKSNEDLIEHLEKNTGVLTPDLKEAFMAVDRGDFVENDHRVEAYEDYPLPIGYGQTISQPTIVAFTLSLLQPKGGERVLDVGCGSGWTTVLLGYLVGAGGEVVGIDIINEFVELTRNRASSYHEKAPNVAVFHASEEDVIYSDGFDKILVNAAFERHDDIPNKMKESLRENGIMVAPIGNDLIVFSKINAEFKEVDRFTGMVSYVPYIKNS